jgi:uncharacterized DUF497 family protein
MRKVLDLSILLYLRYDDRRGEKRWLDLALALIHGRMLALTYTYRGKDVRILSFRVASREERSQYEQDAERD